MSFQFTPYVVPLVILAAVTTWLTVLAVQRRRVAAAKPLVWLMGLLTWWLLSYAFQVSGTDLPTILFWSNATFVSVAFVPVGWLAFALDYSGQSRWLTLRNFILACIVPFATQVVIWDDSALHLFRIGTHVEFSAPLWVMYSTWGPWFSVHAAYSYLLIGIGIVLLARVFFRSKGLYRGQAATLLVGALIPLVMNVVFVIVVKQAFMLDPTPFSFAVTGIMFSVGLFRFRLLDVVPLARDAVVEGMRDGVLVLDGQDRIVDVNPAARRMLAGFTERIIGQPVGTVFAEYMDLVTGAVDVEVQAEITVELAKSEPDTETHRHYDVHLSPLYDRRRQLTGRLMILHDITERKHAEQALGRWVAQFQVLPALSQEIAEVRVLDDLLASAARLIRERFTAYQVGILLADVEGRQAELRAASGEIAEALLVQGYTLEIADVDFSLYASDRSRVPGGEYDTRDVTAEFRIAVFEGETPDARSEIVLPLRVGQRVIGLLVVQSAEVAAFDETAIAVLQTASDQLAVAVENARLLEQMASSMRDMERVFGQYTEQAWRGLSAGTEHLLGYRYRERTVEPITEVIRVGTGEGGFVEVPVTLRDQTIGVLQLHFPEQQVASNVTPLVQEVANRLALTLESARLYQDTQRRAAQEQLIGRVTTRIRESLDMETVLKTATQEMRKALGLDKITVHLEMPQE
jgi:PAS domain S-box-containing protein